MVSQFLFVGHQPVAQRDESESPSATSPSRIRHADPRALELRRVVVNRLLHLLRRYVETVTNDDLLLTTFEPEVSVGVTPSQIATMEPAVPERLSSCRRIVPVSGEVCWTPHGDLAGLAIWRILAVRINHAHFDAIEGFTKRARPNGIRRIEDRWTGLRHPVGFAHWNSEQSLKTFLRAHRNAVAAGNESTKRADLPWLARLLFEQELDHGGQSKGVAALEAFDRVEDQLSVEGRHQYAGPTRDDGWKKDDTNRGDIRHLGHNQSGLQAVRRGDAHQFHVLQ